jgi:hypothetical protein
MNSDDQNKNDNHPLGSLNIADDEHNNSIDLTSNNTKQRWLLIVVPVGAVAVRRGAGDIVLELISLPN